MASWARKVDILKLKYDCLIACLACCRSQFCCGSLEDGTAGIVIMYSYSYSYRYVSLLFIVHNIMVVANLNHCLDFWVDTLFGLWWYVSSFGLFGFGGFACFGFGSLLALGAPSHP